MHAPQNRVTSVKLNPCTLIAGTTMSNVSSPDARTAGDSASTFDGIWIAPNLEIADVAARLPVHRLRTPDALQSATAVRAQSTGFIKERFRLSTRVRFRDAGAGGTSIRTNGPSRRSAETLAARMKITAFVAVGG